MRRAEQCLHGHCIYPNSLSNRFGGRVSYAVSFQISPYLKLIVVTFTGKLRQERSRNAFGTYFFDDRRAFAIFINDNHFFAVCFDNGRRADLFSRAARG